MPNWPPACRSSPRCATCIDLSIVAAFIHQQDFYAQGRLARPPRSTTNGRWPSRRYNTPLQVETVCTAVWKGNHADDAGRRRRDDSSARSAAIAQNVLADEDGKITEVRESIEPEGPARRSLVVGLRQQRVASSSSLRASTSTTRTSQTFVSVGPVLTSAPSGSNQ